MMTEKQIEDLKENMQKVVELLNDNKDQSEECLKLLRKYRAGIEIIEIILS